MRKKGGTFLKSSSEWVSSTEECGSAGGTHSSRVIIVQNQSRGCQTVNEGRLYLQTKMDQFSENLRYHVVSAHFMY